MRRLLPPPIVIFVAVGLLAQTSPPSGKAGVPDASCVVSGRVVTAADGSPLKSARLTLVPETSGQKPQLYPATTDSDGRFVLKDLTPGRYRFNASHTGFVTRSYKTTGADEGALLWLRPGEQVSDVLFRLVVSGVITGRLTNEDGEPMVNAQVLALQEPSEEALEDLGISSGKRTLQMVSSAETDDRGQYRIFGLIPGEYYLKALDTSEPDHLSTLQQEASWIRDILGSEYAPTYYPGVAQAGQAEVIPVKAGDEVQADFFMQHTKTAKISGHVMGKDGPAANTWVNLMLIGGEENWTQRGTTTDEKGGFVLKGVPPGSYLIVVFQSEDDNRVYEPRGQQKVEVNGENIDSIMISVGAGISLQGRVTVDGASSLKLDRISIGLTSVDAEQFSAESSVKKDGTFEIKSVSDGNYGVRVSGLERSWCVKSARFGGDDILEKGMLVEKGGSGGKIEVVVSSKTAQLEGSVSDGDTAVQGARVQVVPEPETPYNRFRVQSLRTDQTGHFSFTGLAPGKYSVRAKSGSSAEGGAVKSEPQIVTLSEQDHKTVQLAVGKAQ